MNFTFASEKDFFTYLDNTYKKVNYPATDVKKEPPLNFKRITVVDPSQGKTDPLNIDYIEDTSSTPPGEITRLGTFLNQEEFENEVLDYLDSLGTYAQGTHDIRQLKVSDRVQFAKVIVSTANLGKGEAAENWVIVYQTLTGLKALDITNKIEVFDPRF